MSYKRLGDHIIEKVEFNDGNKYKLLQGVSNNKYFQKAKTNIIGIDLAKYRVAHHNQFVFNRATTRNGDKISIALRKGESCIVSPSYRIFEVRDENLLHPDYLQMWFTRPEFDRYARFKSHGSAHEFFDMEEMCEVELPIPSIEEQRQIVAQYQSIANKIKVNEQICEKLEATAQALYKHWFVDFEFPNEAGEPYKSSGGKMVWNEELGKEIPEGWKVKSLEKISNVVAGGDKPKIFSDTINKDCNIPIYSNSTDNYGLFGYTNIPKIFEPSITVSARGAIIGYTVLRKSPFVPIVRLITITPDDNEIIYYLFKVIEKFNYDQNGSAQGQLTIPDISRRKVLLPDKFIINEYYLKYKEIDSLRDIYKNQTQKLTQLQSLLLSRLAVGEEVSA